MENITMVEAVVKHDEAKDIFREFCENQKALSPQIAPDGLDKDYDRIVCGFESDEAMAEVIGKIEGLFPGKVSWR